MLIPLPIDNLLPEIIARLQTNANAVIVAEPGAGKSTRVPPAIAATQSGKVLVLQPRRVAARAVAERIAYEHGWKLGEEIGYRIRFENRTSQRTRIIVMTEGILSRLIQQDPFLDGVSAVILDEFHERNLHTDVALALTREVQSAVRPDLKIIVMSATLDAEPVSRFLGDAPVHRTSGRTYPLEIGHTRHDNRPIEVRAAEAIETAFISRIPQAPHMLVFLPGMGEMRRVADALPASLKPSVHLLHSSVSLADQHAALAPSANPKIILATNIAETSLTIDGVGHVIDSGLARVPVHDSRLGIDRLETRRISKASARQRAGRAGRSGPGTCLRLFTAEEHAAMQDYELPEIQRLDLSGVVLLLKNYGVSDVSAFQWFEPPPAAALNRALRLLTLLDVIDGSGNLTAWGREISRLPLHPRLASVFFHGVKKGHAKEAAWLCALLEAGDTTPEQPVRGLHRESDVLDRLYEVVRNSGAASWTIRNSATQLIRLAEKVAVTERGGDRDEILRQALLRGYPDRLVRRRGKGDSHGVMVGQRGVVLSAGSSVLGSQLFLAIDLSERDNSTESFVRSASGIDAGWLPDLLPDLWKEEETVRIAGYKVQGVRRITFADLILEEKELGRLPEGTDTGVIVKAQLIAKHGSPPACFVAVPAAQAWLARYLFLREHMPDADMPSPDLDEALTGACGACRTVAEFATQALSYLQATLPSPAVRLVDKEAPEHLVLPSGNRARISYPVLGPDTATLDSEAQPVVAARVQELFGLAETPRIAAGQVPLSIELLSPARRPVQKTSDLKSFWNGTYQEVRKELRARYPKHPWPEDPWTAPAVNIGRRRG